MQVFELKDYYFLIQNHFRNQNHFLIHQNHFQIHQNQILQDYLAY